jgi:hypothetical protein
MGLEPGHAGQRVRRARRRRAQLIFCSFFLAVVIATAGVSGDWGPFWAGIGITVVIVLGWVLGELTARRLRK